MRPVTSKDSEIEFSPRQRCDTQLHKLRPWLSAGLMMAVVIGCGQTSDEPSSSVSAGGTAGSGAGTGGSGVAGSGGTSGTGSGGDGGNSGTSGLSCPGTDAAIPAKDPLPAPRAASSSCAQPGTPIDVLDRNAAPSELTGTWICCTSSPAPLEPEWTPRACELFGQAHDAIEFTSDGRWRFLAFEGDSLRPVAGAAVGEWMIGGGTPEQGGLTCPLFLRLSNPNALEDLRFRFTRSPTKLWLGLQLIQGGPHYAAAEVD
jgi:hypothetical protein